jgi:hypothetical protein
LGVSTKSQLVYGRNPFIRFHCGHFFASVFGQRAQR